MTVKQCLDFFKKTKAFSRDTFDDSVLLRFLNEVEGMVQTDILHLFHDGITQYTDAESTDELLVVAPYDKLYFSYLAYRIDLLNNETGKASNSKAAFDQDWEDFLGYYTRTYYNTWG